MARSYDQSGCGTAGAGRACGFQCPFDAIPDQPRLTSWTAFAT